MDQNTAHQVQLKAHIASRKSKRTIQMHQVHNPAVMGLASQLRSLCEVQADAVIQREAQAAVVHIVQ